MHSLLQTDLWAELKVTQGWKAHKVDIGQTKPISIIERDLALGKTFTYAPEAIIEKPTTALLKDVAVQAKKLAGSAIFFRLELLERFTEAEQSLVAELTKAGFRKSFEEVQPEHRQWVPIDADEATILSQMKEKGRYNVRLAVRKGVKTRISTDTKDVEVFYKIFEDTAKRDGFKIRSLGYFRSLCTMLFDNKLGELVIAEADGQPLAALIITYYDDIASYLYGASSSQNRNLMAPYAAHFTAMKSAKEHGCKFYDLLQIAPANAPANHRYAGLTRFKELFGGERVDLIGSWDYVYEPVWYSLFKIAEQARRH